MDSTSSSSCSPRDTDSLASALVAAYEEFRHAALVEGAVALDSESQAAPRVRTWHGTATALVRSRRVHELRGSGVWLEFTSSEIAADNRAASETSTRDRVHPPRLVGDSIECSGLLSLLTTLVTDLQLRRLP